jgi:hypothetical protein
VIKKVIWHASKAEMVDATGTLLTAKEAILLFETDPQKITLTFKESTEDGLEGTVKGKTCDWKEAFKNGKNSFIKRMFLLTAKPATPSLRGS